MRDGFTPRWRIAARAIAVRAGTRTYRALTKKPASLACAHPANLPFGICAGAVDDKPSRERALQSMEEALLNACICPFVRLLTGCEVELVRILGVQIRVLEQLRIQIKDNGAVGGKALSRAKIEQVSIFNDTTFARSWKAYHEDCHAGLHHLSRDWAGVMQEIEGQLAQLPLQGTRRWALMRLIARPAMLSTHVIIRQRPLSPAYTRARALLGPCWSPVRIAHSALAWAVVDDGRERDHGSVEPWRTAVGVESIRIACQ